MPAVLVFTATFNEVQNIEQWVAGVTRAVPEADLLVIDDDSPDGTGLLLEELKQSHPTLTVVHRPRKSGLASAHMAAIEYALERDYDYLVTMDADGSHQTSQIPKLLDVAGSADFVIGTRYRGGSHRAKPLRRLLSSAANGLTRVVLPTGLSEYTTSFRVFNPTAMRVVRDADFSAGGYAFFVECVEVLHRSGVVMGEVPIDFIDREHGESKIPRNQIFLSMAALARLGIERITRR